MAAAKAKFRDSEAEYRRIAADIRAGRFAPLYLLMGDEPYFIDSLADLLSVSILDETERAFNQLTLYGRDSDAGQIVNCCRQMPMTGSRQVVIVKEAQQLRNLDKLSLYTAHPQPSTVLVICHKEKNVDRRSQLYKSSAAAGEVFESVKPRDYEIGPWLSRLVGERGLSLDAKALSMLTDHLGTDLSAISNELCKLAVSLPEGEKVITDAHIEMHTGISKEYNNYELCRAVVRRDKVHALTIADRFAANPKDNPLLLTVAALFGEFRRIFIVNYLRWRARVRNIPFPSDQELMQLLKMGNIYALGEVKQVSSAWNNRSVFAILGLLREYDAKSKGVGAGSAGDGELLRELLLKIFTA